MRVLKQKKKSPVARKKSQLDSDTALIRGAAFLAKPHPSGCLSVESACLGTVCSEAKPASRLGRWRVLDLDFQSEIQLSRRRGVQPSQIRDRLQVDGGTGIGMTRSEVVQC